MPDAKLLTDELAAALYDLLEGRDDGRPRIWTTSALHTDLTHNGHVVTLGAVKRTLALLVAAGYAYTGTASELGVTQPYATSRVTILWMTPQANAEVHTVKALRVRNGRRTLQLQEARKLVLQRRDDEVQAVYASLCEGEALDPTPEADPWGGR